MLNSNPKYYVDKHNSKNSDTSNIYQLGGHYRQIMRMMFIDSIDFRKLDKPISDYHSKLSFIPFENRSYDICKDCLSKCGSNLPYVPKNLVNDELIHIALSNYGRSIRYINESERTEKMYEIAVKNDPSVLKFFPENLRYDEKWYKLEPSGAAYMGQVYIDKFIKKYNL